MSEQGCETWARTERVAELEERFKALEARVPYFAVDAGGAFCPAPAPEAVDFARVKRVTDDRDILAKQCGELAEKNTALKAEVEVVVEERNRAEAQWSEARKDVLKLKREVANYVKAHARLGSLLDRTRAEGEVSGRADRDKVADKDATPTDGSGPRQLMKDVRAALYFEITALDEYLEEGRLEQS